jgi:hypothetical protein
MSSSAPTMVMRRTCAQLSSRTQRRSLSSQCLRIISTSSTQTCRRQQRRYQSTDSGAANPKIATIVDQISTLTLLETADLVQSLKVCPSSTPSSRVGIAYVLKGDRGCGSDSIEPRSSLAQVLPSDLRSYPFRIDLCYVIPILTLYPNRHD